MNAETFREWLDRQGHHTLRTCSSFWYDAAPRVLQAFPYHWTVQPQEAELIGLLRRERAVCLRYSTTVDSPKGCISYHAVCGRKGYSLNDLSGRSRQNVRIGLKNCTIELISLERLAEEGWNLEADTSDRQNRESQFTNKSFRKKILSARGLPGFEAWGAIVKGSLAAYILAVQTGETIELLQQACHRDHLKQRINNALSFSLTQMFLNRSEIKSVFYTLQSLDAPASIDEFKFRMGYVPMPVRQRVVFHPFVTPLANQVAYECLSAIANYWPKRRLLAKAKGLLRFYLQGEKPLSIQEWPPSLLDAKGSISGSQRELADPPK